MSTRTLVRVSLAVAVAATLKAFALWRMPQGGTVTIAAWVPIMIAALQGGKRAGIMAGLGYAIVTMILDPYFVHPAQVFLDYLLAGLFLAAPAFFPRSVALGVVVAGIGKLFSHWLSGYVFFGSFAPQGTPAWLYSLVYNLPVVGVEFAISLFVMLTLYYSGVLQTIWPRDGSQRVTTD